MYDPKGRMVVSVNFDTDIGDAWEFADVPYYPEGMTTLAYHYGINYSDLLYYALGPDRIQRRDGLYQRLGIRYTVTAKWAPVP